MEMLFIGIGAIIIYFISGQPKEFDFLIIKRYGMLFMGVCLITTAIAVKFLEIGFWFLFLSIPGSLLLAIWVYFRDQAKKNSDQHR